MVKSPYLSNSNYTCYGLLCFSPLLTPCLCLALHGEGRAPCLPYDTPPANVQVDPVPAPNYRASPSLGDFRQSPSWGSVVVSVVSPSAQTDVGPWCGYQTTQYWRNTPLESAIFFGACWPCIVTARRKGTRPSSVIKHKRLVQCTNCLTIDVSEIVLINIMNYSIIIL